MLLNGDPGGFVFFEADPQERGLNFSLGGCEIHRNCLVVILLSFLFNDDNLTLKLHHEKRSYPNENGFSLADSKLEVCQERLFSS